MATLDGRGLPQGYAFREGDEIAPRVVAAMAAHAPMMLDVRTQSEWDICHIDRARLIPLQSLEARLDDLKADLGDRLDTPLVVYCHHGRRSLTATFMLRAAGFTDVRSLAGGIDLWARDIDPRMPTY